MPSKEEVLNELKKVKDPHTGLDVVSMGLIEDVEVDDNRVCITVRPTNPFCPSALAIVEQIKAVLESSFENVDADVKLVGHVLAEEDQ